MEKEVKFVIKGTNGKVYGYIHYVNGEYDVVRLADYFPCSTEKTLSAAKEKAYKFICPKSLCTIKKAN